jgi:hypothetical protein
VYYIFIPNIEKRRREEKESREVVGECIGGQGTISVVLKVPRQCPLVPLVEVMHIVTCMSQYRRGFEW